MRPSRLARDLRYASLYARRGGYDVAAFYDLLGHAHSWGDERRCLNLGYWKRARTMDDANRALVELVARAAGLRRGDRVIDLGCGFGDQDAELVERFGVAGVDALNVAAGQVRHARAAARARGLDDALRFHVASATAIPFAADSFDAAIAVESAFHFRSREDFFGEAARVLRAGGRIAIADILLVPSARGVKSRVASWMHRASLQYQPENMYDAAAYRARMERAGFEDVAVASIKYFVFPAFRRYCLEHPEIAGRHFWLFRQWLRFADRLATADAPQLDYVIVTARRRSPPTRPAPRVGATAFHFGPSSSPLWGWHHPPRAGTTRPAGVVICPPLGHDYVGSYRSMRQLAERLADAGFPVLRFDYRSTGDSPDAAAQVCRATEWVEDVAAAIDALRVRSGARVVALVGCRMGALLAMLAARERDVDGVIAWSPCVTGARYLREVRILGALARPAGGAGPGADPDAVDVQGFVLPGALAADIGRLDGRASASAPLARALVIGTGDAPSEAPLVDHLRAAGVRAELLHLPGAGCVLADPEESVVSGAALRAATEWMCAAYPETPAPPAGPVERPVRFGERQSDFGILALPPGTAPRPERPAIVILNRFGGTARGQVEMARRWAGIGFPVFRFDPVGVASRFLGDEPGDPAATARDALDALTRRFGLERFVVVGLCGGADLAFRLAGACERVVGAVLVNPATVGLDVAEGREGARPPDFAAQVRAMGARGVRAYVVCSEHDPGLVPLRAAVRRHFAESGLPPTLRLETVAEGDGHVFATTASQRRLHDLLTRWVEATFP